MVRDCHRSKVSIALHTSLMGLGDIPRNLLDNLSNKRSALTEMTLGSANSGLDNSCLGFLFRQKSDRLAH